MAAIQQMNPDLAVEKLKQQNDKLRSELRVMTRALDEAVQKQRKHERSKARAPIKDLESLSETEKTLLGVLSRIKTVKAELRMMHKNLEGNLNEGKITGLENKLAYLQGRVKELSDEKESMERIEAEQKKALEAVEGAQNYPHRMKAITEETAKLKERNREIKKTLKNEERKFKEAHQTAVDLEEKFRKLKAQLKAKKHLALQDEDEPSVPVASENDVNEIKTKQQQTEAQREEEERRLTGQVKQIEAQIREKQHNISVLEIQLKEKDQEYRLTMLKIKELKRLTRHSKLKPITRSDIVSPKSVRQEEVQQPAQKKTIKQSIEYENEQDVDLDSRVWAAANQNAKQIEDFEFRGPQRYR